MLTNVPTAEEMEQNALRIYFTAWEHVIRIIAEMSGSEVLSFSVSHGKMKPNQDNAQDIDEYIARSQSDLQIAYTLIQQSQEIALKAKICEVSPFLLLLGTDVRTWPASADFTRFRTLDAVDLVRVVNAVSPQSLSDEFINMFESIRGNRNLIYHLGTFADRLDPVVLIDILIKQYHELHPNRNWLYDRYNFECDKRYGIFYTRHYNEITIILLEISVLLSMLTNIQYQHVFGFSKKQRRYICHSCCAEAGDLRVRAPILRASKLQHSSVVRMLFFVTCAKRNMLLSGLTAYRVDAKATSYLLKKITLAVAIPAGEAQETVMEFQWNGG